MEQKSLFRKVAEGTVYFSSNSLLLKGISLANVFLILRQLSVYEYGLFELALSAVAIIGILQLPGLSETISADMLRAKGEGDPGRAKRLLLDFHAVQTALAIAAAAIVFFGSSVIALYFKGEISALLRLLALPILLLPVRTAVQILFTVNLEYFYQSVQSFTEEALRLGFLAILFFAFDMRVEALPLSILLSQILAILFVFVPARRVFASLGELSPRSGSWLDIFKYHGLWSVATTYMSNFGQAMRVGIIRLFLGTEAVGLYSVAQGLYGHTVSLVPLGRVVSPLIPQYANDPGRVSMIAVKAVKYQLVAYAALGVVAVFVFPPIISYLFPNYASAMPLYQLMLVSLIPNSAASIVNTLYMAYKEQRSLFFATVLKTVFILGCAPVCLYLFGINGMALELFFVTTLFTAERYRKIGRIVPGLTLGLRHMAKTDETDKMIVSRLLNAFKIRYARIVR